MYLVAYSDAVSLKIHTRASSWSRRRYFRSKTIRVGTDGQNKFDGFIIIWLEKAEQRLGSAWLPWFRHDRRATVGERGRGRRKCLSLSCHRRAFAVSRLRSPDLTAEKAPHTQLERRKTGMSKTTKRRRRRCNRLDGGGSVPRSSRLSVQNVCTILQFCKKFLSFCAKDDT